MGGKSELPTGLRKTRFTLEKAALGTLAADAKRGVHKRGYGT